MAGSDFVPEAREQKDVAICREIEVKNWKQALKLVEKRAIKDQSSWVEALKCYIQCSHPSYSERVKGTSTILRLGTSQKKVYQSDELELYDHAADLVLLGRQSRDVHDAVCQARVDSVKANPRDEQLARRCLFACIEANDIGHSLEIVPVLQANFPEKREYQFWTITLRYLRSLSQRTGYRQDNDTGSTAITSDPKFFLRLAFGHISVITRENINKSNQDRIPPAVSIKTPQELLLLYILADKAEKAGLAPNVTVPYIEHPYVGAASPLAKGDWALQLELLEYLIAKEDWQKLFAVTDGLLQGARTNNKLQKTPDDRGADLKVWKAYLKAASELGKSHIDRAADEIKLHMDPAAGLQKTYLRNAHIAGMEWTFKTADPFWGGIYFSQGQLHTLVEDSKGKTSGRTARCLQLINYVNNHAYATSAFEDVKPYVEQLTVLEQKFLINTVAPLLGQPQKKVTSIVDENGENIGDFDLHREELSDPPPAKDTTTDIRHKVDRMTSGITSLKLHYFVRSSCQEVARKHLLKATNATRTLCSWCNKECAIYCRPCLEIIASIALFAYAQDGVHDEEMSKFLLPTDRHPADGYAIIAAMCLIKIGQSYNPHNIEGTRIQFCGPQIQRYLQASAILDLAHKRSAPNPDITLLLIRLYTFLGASSLAMQAYQDLHLKQIQQYTLGYVMLDRISSIHPLPQDESRKALESKTNPATDLVKLQSVFRKSKGQIVNNIWTSLQRGSYTVVLQLYELYSQMTSSKAAAMSIIERRRVDRMTNPNVVISKESHGFDLIPEDAEKLNYTDGSEKFDYRAFPNYEHSEAPPFEIFTRIGPTLNDVRTAGYLKAEQLHELAAYSLNDDKEMLQDCLQRLTAGLHDTGKWITETLRDSDGSPRDLLTEPEFCYVSITVLLSSFVTCLVRPDLPFVEETCMSQLDILANAVMKLGKMAIRAANDLPTQVPIFNTALHPLYVQYETEVLLAAVLKFLTGSGKPLLKKGSEACIEKYVKMAVSVNGIAWIMSKRVSYASLTGDWIDRILDLSQDTKIDTVKTSFSGPDGEQEFSVARLVTHVVGANGMELWAANVRNSWVDSVDCLKQVCRKTLEPVDIKRISEIALRPLSTK